MRQYGEGPSSTIIPSISTPVALSSSMYPRGKSGPTTLYSETSAPSLAAVMAIVAAHPPRCSWVSLTETETPGEGKLSR